MDRFESLGGEIVLSERFAFEEKDILVNVERIKEFDVDAILFLAQTNEAAYNFKDSMNLKLKILL